MIQSEIKVVHLGDSVSDALKDVLGAACLAHSLGNSFH